MKIAIVTDFKPESGLGRYAFELHKNLKKTELIYFNSKNKNIRNIKIIKKAEYGILKTTLNEIFYIPKIIKSNEYELVHSSNQFLSNIRTGGKKIITVHDINSIFTNDFNPIIRYFHKNMYDKIDSFDRIITVSESTKKELQRYYEIDDNKIDVIYEGVDFKKFKLRSKTKSRLKLKLPLDKKIILHVGSSLKRKNIEGLIKIFYKIRKSQKDCTLVRVGDTNSRINNLIRNYKLENNIIQINNIKDDILSLCYNSADLFILPSYLEGFGFPIIESMASGLPIVASNVSSVPELLNNKDFLLDPNDINKFAEVSIRILTDKNLKYNIIKNNLKQVKRFDWKITAKKTWSVYKKCLL